MSKKVRDIVHNYIYLTPIEELITENPLFLRLHYIHQNSFTYLTYPSAHNTRFSHSLGVMHVAGGIFQAAFARTPPVALQTFLLRVKAEFERLEIPAAGNASSPLSLSAVVEEMTSADTAHFFDNAVYNSFLRVTALGALRDHQREKAALAIILLQAIRMAAMLHDVGHPPFSHIVEYALLEGLIQRKVARDCDESVELDYKGHEHASGCIATQILGGASFESHRYAIRTPNFFAACAAFTKSMFSEESRLVGLKKTLLSGDLDADRLDYVLRDAKSAGLRLDYDLERLQDAAFLTNHNDSPFTVSYHLGALPTIENFFNARYDLYRWMIYHHDTSRRNLVVQRFIILLLESKKLDRGIQEIAKTLCHDACGGDNSNFLNYRRFIDGSLVDRMWSVLEIIENKRSTTQDELDLKFYLEVILSRSNYILPSLCKTPGDYAYLASKALNKRNQISGNLDLGEPHIGHGNTFEDLNTQIRRRFSRLTNNLVEEFGKSLAGRSGNPEKDAEGIAKYRLAREIELVLRRAVDEEFGKGVYTVYFYYIGSFKASFTNPFELHPPAGGGNPVPIRELSPTIEMLETAWSKSPQVMIYLRISENKALELAEEGAETREAIFRAIRDIVGEALRWSNRHGQRSAISVLTTPGIDGRFEICFFLGSVGEQSN
ncbi:MAG: hypothetical protein LC634_11075 [Sphingomonadales bacterium]|nr:hypothetical protein [Sphingomonadales bacterium]